MANIGRGLIWPFRLIIRYFGWVARPGRSWPKRVVLGGLGLGATLGLLLFTYALLLVPFTPGLGHLREMKVQHPTLVVSADGETLHRFQERNRAWVPLSDVSEHVVAALVATEDHRFYRHHGIDVRRLLSSTVYTLAGDRQGGSTITMQLARNMYPRRIGQASSLTRKLKEIVTAFKIEAVYEKDEILEVYLNTVPYLYNVYGIELAARTYFSKGAAALDVVESATLVGMLKATSYYNPVRNPDQAVLRRNVVLRQMAKHDVVTADELAALQARPLRTRFDRQALPMRQAPHFVAHVRTWLTAWADDHGYNLYSDGLKVVTTLDMRMQRLAEEAVLRQGEALQAVADVEWSRAHNPLRSHSPHDYAGHRRSGQAFAHYWAAQTDHVDRFVRATHRYRAALAAGTEAGAALAALRADGAFMDSLRTVKTRLEAGFVAIDPRTAEVKAWVGSRSYARSQYDRVAVARRQPGSTFKPFVYAAALEAGYKPDDRLPDRAVAIEVGRDQVWRPVNAGGFSNEDVTLRHALAQSKNNITAQLIDEVGPRRTARLARRMGVNRSTLSAVPSLALGTSEVTLLEMVSAYTTIAAGGVYREPVVVTRIEDHDGNVVADFTANPRTVLDERASQALIDMMRGVIDEGTGRRIRSVFGIRADVAGKTGTTQDNADGWFLMMHPHLVAGAWVGFDDPRVAFRSDYWGQGAHNALYVVGDFYRQALRQGRLDPRPRLAPVPVYDQRTPFFARVGSWVEGTVADIGSRFRRDDGDRPRVQRNRFANSNRDSNSNNNRNSNGNRDSDTPRAERSDDGGLEDLARNLGEVLREVDQALNRRSDDVGEAYRVHLEDYVEQAERFLEEQLAAQQRTGRRRTRGNDDVERQIRRALDQYATDLSPRQRANLERFIQDAAEALDR